MNPDRASPRRGNGGRFGAVLAALIATVAAVAVRWSDGTVQWATIPLPPDWPASPAGAANEMTDPVPAHLAAAVGAG